MEHDTASILKWGVLGVAKIAVEKVIPAIQASSNGRVVAIASRDPVRGEEAADRLGIPKSFSSYDDLLACPDVEAVYIPLPNHLHHEWTLKAAEHDKHVLCEKPLSVTSREAAEMVEACADAEVLLDEGFMYRHHPAWRAVCNAVSEGVIGEIKAVHTIFGFSNTDPSNIRNRPETGGGAMLDIGCYPIDLSRMLFEAEPQEVHGAIRWDSELGVETDVSALMEFERGHASFFVSTRLDRWQSVTVSGTEAHIHVDLPFNIPPDQEIPIRVSRGGPRGLGGEHTSSVVPPTDQYQRQAEAFAAAVSGESTLTRSAAEGVRVLEVIEQIFQQDGNSDRSQ